MPTEDEKLDQIDKKLSEARERATDIKKRADELDRETKPPRPATDHTNDGGVI
jgi:hypothetical protein